MRCARCARYVESVDCEVGQCKRCNADDLHEAGLWVLVNSLEPAHAALYRGKLEAFLKWRGKKAAARALSMSDPAAQPTPEESAPG